MLGPGSDWYHEDHVHLDLAERRSGYRICQWDIWDPLPKIAPLLPVGRPDDAPPRETAEEKAKREAAEKEAGEEAKEAPAPQPAPRQKKRPANAVPVDSVASFRFTRYARGPNDANKKGAEIPAPFAEFASRSLRRVEPPPGPCSATRGLTGELPALRSSTTTMLPTFTRL